MLDKIEMGNTKQLRKTLLITSFVGISFDTLFANATGNFEFFGFKIPVEDTSVIPTLVGFMILYFLIALIIRYSNERFRERYKEGIEYAKDSAELEISQFQGRGDGEEPSDFDIVYEQKFRNYLRDNGLKRFVRREGMYFLDIYFPILLGFFAVLKIFLLTGS